MVGGFTTRDFSPAKNAPKLKFKITRGRPGTDEPARKYQRIYRRITM